MSRSGLVRTLGVGALYLLIDALTVLALHTDMASHDYRSMLLASIGLLAAIFLARDALTQVAR